MTTQHEQRLEKASRLSRRLLAVLVGVLATLTLIVSGAAAASAQNAFGPQPVAMILTVGPNTAAAQTVVGVRGPPALRLVSATGVAADTAGDGYPAIKAGSSGGPTSGQRFPGSVRQEELGNNPSTCVYCHMDTDSPQVDHVIPRSRRGNATIDNAQTTCAQCNASKGARDFPVTPPGGYEGPWPPPWWGSGP